MKRMITKSLKKAEEKGHHEANEKQIPKESRRKGQHKANDNETKLHHPILWLVPLFDFKIKKLCK
jgi:hypothetical protein